jgi:hypothetical protein
MPWPNIPANFAKLRKKYVSLLVFLLFLGKKKGFSIYMNRAET